MKDGAQATRISQVGTVFVPVSDQDRALEFYVGTSRSGLVSAEVNVEDPVPAQFFFRDIDGNRFLIVAST